MKMTQDQIIAAMQQDIQDTADKRVMIGRTHGIFSEPYTIEKWIGQCEALAQRLTKYTAMLRNPDLAPDYDVVDENSFSVF
jgi:adenylosuccinate lyase